jgi:F-type H+-transporting ATPase subunit b
MELLLPNLGLFFWTLIIFLAFFFILRSLAWKPILKALHDREQGITSSLAAAESARSEIVLLTSQNDTLFKKAMIERNLLLDEAARQKDTILAEAKEQAQKEYARRMADTEQAINAAKQAAITELRNTTAQLAITIAERLVRKQLDNPAESQRLAQEMVTDLKLN